MHWSGAMTLLIRLHDRRRLRSCSPSPGSIPLEHKLQPELHLAHGTAVADPAEHCRAEDVGIRDTPVRMVRGIERLPAELQVVTLPDAEILGQRGIEIAVSRGEQGIAIDVAVAELKFRIGGVERAKIPEQVRRGVGDYGADSGGIGPAACAGEQEIGNASDTYGVAVTKPEFRS